MSFVQSSSASKLKPGGPLGAPSPTPSASLATSVRQHAKPSVTSVMAPFSQPPETGTGKNLVTQIVYTRDYLKEKDRPLSFEEIWDYLSIPATSDTTPEQLRRIFQSGKAQINYDPNGLGGRGSYSFKTTHDVHSPKELKGLLHRIPTSQGIQVKELKDGWKGASDAIHQLESSHDVLVLRNKKNMEARVVWADDPGLHTNIQGEFKVLWHQMPLPSNPDDIRLKLEAKGLKATTERRIAKVNAGDKKKRKGPRKGGRQTNTHMVGMLKDYSHLRK